MPQILVPSKPLTESSASLGFSISMKAKSGGLLATHTFLTVPYLGNKHQSVTRNNLLRLQTVCIPAESVLKVILVGIVPTPSNEHFAGRIPVPHTGVSTTTASSETPSSPMAPPRWSRDPPSLPPSRPPSLPPPPLSLSNSTQILPPLGSQTPDFQFKLNAFLLYLFNLM